jgi:hypothetical protein
MKSSLLLLVAISIASCYSSLHYARDLSDSSSDFKLDLTITQTPLWYDYGDSFKNCFGFCDDYDCSYAIYTGQILNPRAAQSDQINCIFVQNLITNKLNPKQRLTVYNKPSELRA